MEKTMSKGARAGFFALMAALGLIFLAPIVIVLMNSFIGRFFISDARFAPPRADTFVGLENY